MGILVAEPNVRLIADVVDRGDGMTLGPIVRDVGPGGGRTPRPTSGG